MKYLGMAYKRVKKIKSKRKQDSKKRNYKRQTIKRGGRTDYCRMYRDQFEEYKIQLRQQTSNTILNLYEDIRILYDNARRKNCPQIFLREIEEFENGELKRTMNALLQ